VNHQEMQTANSSDSDKLPVVLLVIGMAGSGKTTLMKVFFLLTHQ
jgi:polynucleotide 5'-kinase involved in rRNA processing